MESLLAFALEVGKILGELGKTPYEPLKEEHEESMSISETIVEKQIQVLNESLISLLRQQRNL
jgi:hypothetical protein